MATNFGFQSNAMSQKQLAANANWYLALGISMVVFGTLAVIFSFTSTLFSIIYLGAMLIVLGIMEAVKAFKLSKWSSFFLHIGLGILYVAGGGFILYNPALNAITLTLMLAIFFVVAGIARMIFALVGTVPHKGWLILNGALTLLLGVLIWQQWPVSGLWAIGMLVGVDAIFTGWTWVMLSSMAKKVGTKSSR